MATPKKMCAFLGASLLILTQAITATSQEQSKESNGAETQEKDKSTGEAERKLVIAEHLLALGKAAEARRWVEQVAAADPDVDCGAQIVKYRILIAQGDLRGAEDLGEEIVESHKNDASKLLAFAIAIRDGAPKSADLALAEKILLRVNETTLEENSDAWEMLSTIHSRRGKHGQALEALAKMESLAKDVEAKQDVQLCKIRALLKKKDFAAANALVGKLLPALKNDVVRLECAAAVFLDDQDAGKEMLDMADKFVGRAMEAAKDDDAKDEVRVLKLRLLLKKKERAAIQPLADQLFERAKNDFDKLAQVVTPLMDGSHCSAEELALAEQLVARANERKKGEDWMFLAFLSKIYLLQGKLDKAITAGSQAVNKSKDDETKRQMQENLDVLQTLSAAIKASSKKHDSSR